jgi:hypothetical protein
MYGESKTSTMGVSPLSPCHFTLKSILKAKKKKKEELWKTQIYFTMQKI